MTNDSFSTKNIVATNNITTKENIKNILVLLIIWIHDKTSPFTTLRYDSNVTSWGANFYGNECFNQMLIKFRIHFIIC